MSIGQNLRESEITGDPETEWEPATTAAEPMDALVHTGKLGKTMTEFAVPSYAVLNEKDGIDTYTNANDVTELPEQLNAIRVLLAEVAALRKASNDAMARACGLRELYGLHKH